MVNIIADIAGQYDTLMALLKKMPDEEVISIGDMVDRGPDSNKVVEWFMKNGKALMGNHEHMMVDEVRQTYFYSGKTWQWNGGSATIDSYGGLIQHIPRDHIAWMNGLPLYMEIDDCLVSHSFIDPDISLEEACNLGKDSYSMEMRRCIIWNRYEPIRRKWRMQISGHNSQFGLRTFADAKGDFAICIDDCTEKKLTGIHLPSLEVFQQDYI